MRVALFSPTQEPLQGWGRYTLEVCQNLSQRLQVTLYLPKESPRDKNTSFPVRYILPPFQKNFSSHSSEKVFINPDIEVKADIIHSLVSFPYGILAHSIAKKKCLPFLITAHGTYGVKPLFSNPEKELLKAAYGEACRVLVPSRFSGKTIERIIKRKIPWEFLPNGVDYDKFQKASCFPSFKKWQGRKILLNVGELKPRKGQDIIIKALPLVRKYFPNILLLLVGKNSWGEYLKGLVRKLDLEGSIEFLGRISEEELISIYQLSDIFVHTPRRVNWKFEGFGLVYLEAGACGKPVIGSHSGGVEDAVIDGVTGLLVPENKPRATARAILKLLKDKTLAEKLGKRGKERAEKLTWKNYVEKLVDIYSDCLK